MRISVDSTHSFVDLAGLEQALGADPDCLTDVTLIKVSGRRYRIDSSGIANAVRTFWQRLKDCFTCCCAKGDRSEQITEAIQQFKLRRAEDARGAQAASNIWSGDQSQYADSVKRAWAQVNQCADQARKCAMKVIDLAESLCTSARTDLCMGSFSHARTAMPAVDLDVSVAMKAANEASEAAQGISDALYRAMMASTEHEAKDVLLEALGAVNKAVKAEEAAKAACIRVERQAHIVKAHGEAAPILEPPRF